MNEGIENVSFYPQINEFVFSLDDYLNKLRCLSSEINFRETHVHSDLGKLLLLPVLSISSSDRCF